MKVRACPVGRVILGSLAVALLVILLSGFLNAAAGITASEREHPSDMANRTAHIAAIRSALASRTRQMRVAERVEEKLAALSDEEIRLAGALAERILNGEPTVAADIAFLLLTALIVTL